MLDSSSSSRGRGRSSSRRSSGRRSDSGSGRGSNRGGGRRPRSRDNRNGRYDFGEDEKNSSEVFSEDTPPDDDFVRPEPVESFSEMDLSDDTKQALEELGFEKPSAIQKAFVPIALTGRDVTGQARTGTGKTCAFVLPILEHIDHDEQRVQALVLAPTRELSEQVANEARRISKRSPVRTAVLVGGRPVGPQVDDLKKGAQVVVGTPGRVIDMLGRGHLKLDNLRLLVLDEADRMLDIGFRPDIERILRQCPRKRQTLLLSATMPPPVERLAKKYMNHPLKVDVSIDQVAATDVVKQYYVTVDHDRKFRALVEILKKEHPAQVLVFTRTKRGADNLHRKFRNKIRECEVIHGDLPQRKRDKVMRMFRAGEIRMMIATDVVGRGIDISGISHIINFDIPEFCDDYVHRIGRTGRLSSDEEGQAVTLVTQEQGEELTRIENRINLLIEPYPLDTFEPVRKKRVTKVAEPPPKIERVEFFIDE